MDSIVGKKNRDVPIAIFLAVSDFLGKSDLPMPLFDDSDFLSMNYNWQHIQTKIYANFYEKLFT